MTKITDIYCWSRTGGNLIIRFDHTDRLYFYKTKQYGYSMKRLSNLLNRMNRERTVDIIVHPDGLWSAIIIKELDNDKSL
jgi:hypothetical protein